MCLFDIGLNESCQGFFLVSDLSNWVSGLEKPGDKMEVYWAKDGLC